jgi:hypothetical protein
MRIIITPLVDPDARIDVTEGIVSAIADQLARRSGGNPVLNSMEAERQLLEILRRGTDWIVGEDGAVQ